MRRPAVSTAVVSLAVLVASTALSACGAVHPGAAAIINGERITQEDAHIATAAFCATAVAQGGDVSRAEMARQAIQQLVIAEVAEQVAADENIDVEAVRLSAAELAQVEQQFPDDVDAITATFERIGKVNAIAEALGQRTGADADAAMEAGFATLQEAVQDGDLDIDPRFGIATPSLTVTGSGSLSVPDPENVPRTTRATSCA